ncbi:O-antigen ligase family protein [Clostridium rectalis]|uniref:O-antigen ligase family protein n=1 Tax=Clostridium rectalis TaxID=2040295 RepID=UPI000F633775|nr:O-antigen ligase family protein [Clostridium rectalis]
MKYYLQKILHYDKKVLGCSFLISFIVAILNVNGNSKKDVFMLFSATFLLLNEIYLSFKDGKKSVLLFLISLPFFVTARKFVQIDFFIFKISFETIFITTVFIYNIKNIFTNIKYKLKTGDKNTFKFYILVSLFIIFVYNSNSYSVYFWKSISDTYLGVVTPIMFMLIIITMFNKNDMRNIIYSIILSVNLSCLYGFVQIFKDGISLHNINKNRALLTFGYHNVNIFAGILVTVLPFVLEYILYNKNSKSEKKFLYSSLCIQTAALLITFTRGAWLSALIAVFLILISKKYKKLVIVMVVIGAILIKPAMSFILTRGNNVSSFLENESSIARIQSIYTDVRIIKDYPFGVGMSSFPEYYKEFATRGYLMMPEDLRWKVKAAHYMLEHAHNIILQIGVEFGLISLLIYILLMVNRIKVSFKDYSKNRSLFVSLITYLIFSTLTGNEFNHKGVITGTIIIFLVLGLMEINNEGSVEA